MFCGEGMEEEFWGERRAWGQEICGELKADGDGSPGMDTQGTWDCRGAPVQGTLWKGHSLGRT
jgi:hypothetical protein